MGSASWTVLAAGTLGCLAPCGCGSSHDDASVFPSTYGVEDCDDLDEVRLGSYFVQNNQWGKGDLVDFEQCIRMEDAKTLPLRFTWRWPEVSPGQVKGYPFIGYGQDPWRPTSTGPGLPAVASALTRLTVSYQMALTVSGKYNVAFDVWVTSAPGVTSPPEANITRELMIWLEASEDARAELAPIYVDDVVIDGEAYSFHHVTDVTDAGVDRAYLAFLKADPERTGSTNLAEFIAYLVAQGQLGPEEYIRNVFLGAEIWFGTGELALEQFEVTVE